LVVAFKASILCSPFRFYDCISTEYSDNENMEGKPPPLYHVLVIGGCGFLGSHIVEALLAHPSRPRVLVASRSPTHNFVDGVEYHEVDISEESALKALLSTLRPNVIINTAAPLAKAGAQASASTTINGTSFSLACAAECSSVESYIYISSCSIVAGMPFSLLTESAATLINPTSHHDPYSAAKATAHGMVLGANSPPKLRTAVLRPCGIIGERDTQVIPALLMLGGKECLAFNLETGGASLTLSMPVTWLMHVYVAWRRY
jgi:sterol-4alpha-carboxylate 3-dehydrogenase (decarboxylating)